jgi:hypothetical protein
MRREEMSSLFIPIFDQIYGLVDGQMQSILDKSEKSDVEIKVLILFPLLTLDHIHSWGLRVK